MRAAWLLVLSGLSACTAAGDPAAVRIVQMGTGFTPDQGRSVPPKRYSVILGVQEAA
jgi:hypothetical protein